MQPMQTFQAQFVEEVQWYERVRAGDLAPIHKREGIQKYSLAASPLPRNHPLMEDDALTNDYPSVRALWDTSTIFLLLRDVTRRLRRQP